jgi:hypothetical protein
VERLERIEGRQRSQAALEASVPELGGEAFPAFSLDPDGALPLPLVEGRLPLEEDLDDAETPVLWSERLLESLASVPRPRWSMPQLSMPRPALDLPALPSIPRSALIGSAAFAGVAVLVGVFSLVGLRREATSTAEADLPTAERPSSQQPSSQEPAPKAQLQSATDAAPEAMVLEGDEPSLAQLQDLLQAWLNRKAIVLAGGSLQEARLADVARKGLLEQVQEEQARDAAAGTTQLVKASITSADLVSRSPNRIELRAQVAYSDQRLDADSKVVDTTAAGTLTVTYVFGRDGKRWRLHAYVNG